METMKAWQCIGCGRLEAQQTCVGICQDRPVQLVYAADYAELTAEAERLRERLQRLEAFVGMAARAAPRSGRWEDSYRALQLQARALLAR
jgi:hypothetical protein